MQKNNNKINVRFLKTDKKARYQGYTFYFKEGFCWTDVSKEIKCRLKQNGVFDVLSMSLFSLCKEIPDWYFVCLMNNDFMSAYVNTFINNTVHFQINDARKLPIIIPDKNTLEQFRQIFDEAVNVKKSYFNNTISELQAEKKLKTIQENLDELVNKLYLV